ncbi:hypothetical protein [Elizabethkingia anophelis]|uniref:hypothetical protein n=1 Tax=Elizabethkingia anophelis TaxID=1117645 RepID=UPI00320B5992
MILATIIWTKIVKIMLCKYVKSKEVKDLENQVHAYNLKRNKESDKRYYSDRTAPELEKCIIHYSFLCGFFAEKVQSMGRQIFKGEKPVFVRNNNTTGQSDISVIIPGFSVRVEVKCLWTNDIYQNDAQKKYQRQVERAGGIYLIIREFAEFKNWLDSFIEKYNLKNERRKLF